MTTRRTLLTIVLLSTAALAFSLWVYPRLPEMVPSQWNIQGELDDTI